MSKTNWFTTMMSGRILRIVVSVGAVFVSFLLLLTISDSYRDYFIKKVDGIDAIALRDSLRSINVPDGMEGNLPKDQWPMEVARLKPRAVLLRNGYVLVYVSTFARVSILVFDAGAEQFGTRRLADGIWFWDGVFSASHPPPIRKPIPPSQQ